MELWFDGATYGWVFGAALGVIGGGIGGSLIGIFASKGKYKSLVYSFCFIMIFTSLVLLILGCAALAVGQPYPVWHSLFLPGAIGTILYTFLLPVVKRRYAVHEKVLRSSK